MNLPVTTDMKNQDNSLSTKRLSRCAEEIERYTLVSHKSKACIFHDQEDPKCAPCEFMRTQTHLPRL